VTLFTPGGPQPGYDIRQHSLKLKVDFYNMHNARFSKRYMRYNIAILHTPVDVVVILYMFGLGFLKCFFNYG
jgi:hypothetical protein